jgi:hypothetical protein
MFQSSLQKTQQLNTFVHKQFSILNVPHALNDSEIKAMFDSSLRLFLDARQRTSEFMCSMRQISKAIAHLHAITMLNCLFLLCIVFLVSVFADRSLSWACVQQFLREHSSAISVMSVVRILFYIFAVFPLFNCFFFPVALVRKIPFQFQELCAQIDSVSKLISDTFNPYM